MKKPMSFEILKIPLIYLTIMRKLVYFADLVRASFPSWFNQARQSYLLSDRKADMTVSA